MEETRCCSRVNDRSGGEVNKRLALGSAYTAAAAITGPLGCFHKTWRQVHERLGRPERRALLVLILRRDLSLLRQRRRMFIL